METAIPALIVIALLLLTSVTLAEQILESHEAAAESWLEMEERELERSRTDVSIVGAYAPWVNQVVVVVRNEGQTKLADFEEWDVILRTDSTAEWYEYGEWTEEIDETLEAGILNPGEQMTVTVSATVGSNNLVVLTTPNGISASQVFTH